MNLTCTSDSSNPVAQLTWKGATDYQIGPTVYEPGDYNADFVRGTLMIKAQKEDNGKEFTCEVKTSENLMETSFILNVTCKYLVSSSTYH